jgi:small subunit ribosomal protein S24e
MEIKVTSEKQNPMLRRKEISFQIEHGQAGSTPSRLEVRKAIAATIKTDENVVFVKKFATKTGTQTAYGIANIYDTIEQAKLIEPEYIIERNIPAEKTKEDKETKEAQEPKQPKEAKEEKKA